MTDKINPLKVEFNIHMTKQPVIKAYRKILIHRYKCAGIKNRVSFIKMSELFINKFTHDSVSYGGFIFDETGDVKINYHVCTKYYYKQGHADVIGQIVSIISHEFMHYILLKEHGEPENSGWDNIAHSLEFNGFLGG